MSKSPIHRSLRSSLADFEHDIDLIGDLLSQGEGHDRKVRLLAYAGYRNAQAVRVKGRIVRFEPALRLGDGMIQNLAANSTSAVWPYPFQCTAIPGNSSLLYISSIDMLKLDRPAEAGKAVLTPAQPRPSA